MIKFILTIIILISSPIQSEAFSFKKEVLKSGLNQYFLMEIPISVDNNESIKNSDISIGTLQDFYDYEVHRNPSVSSLFIKLIRKGKHKTIIIKSRHPIKDPMFSILLKVKIKSSYHIKRINVLLDDDSLKR